VKKNDAAIANLPKKINATNLPGRCKKINAAIANLPCESIAIANIPKKINAANLPGRCKENQRCHRKFAM